MTGNDEKPGTFDAIRARAIQMRIDSLHARLNSVSLLCEIAGNANPNITAEALRRARTAFDHIRQEVNGSQALSEHGSGELMRRITDIEAQLAWATQRLQIIRGEEEGENDGNDSGEQLAS